MRLIGKISAVKKAAANSLATLVTNHFDDDRSRSRESQHLKRGSHSASPDEQTWREQGELLHTVVSNAPLILWALDRDGVFTLSDGKGLQALGLKPGQVVGQSVFDLYAGAPNILADIRRALAGEHFVSNSEVSGRVYETHHTPMFGETGGVTGVVGVSIDVTEHRQAERALVESEHKYRELVDEAASIILRWDRLGNVTFFNEFAQQFFGFRESEIVGRNVVGTIVPEKEFTGRDLAQLMREICEDPSKFEYNENENIKRNGDRVWIAWKNKPVFDADGNLIEVLSVGIDITARKRAEEAMRQHASALEQTADAVVITDRDGIIQYVNPAFEITTGYSRDDAVGATPRILKSDVHEAEFYQRLWTTICDGEVFADVFVNRRKDGSLYYEEKTITPLKNDQGAVTHFIATGKDITERMQIQERLRYLAHHDLLTGLPNRVLFNDRLEHALSLTREKDRTISLLFLDLDRFKIINDTRGHAAGDRTLQILATRLQQSVRKGDTIARLGGDEFGVILEGLGGAENVAPIARKLLQVLSNPLTLDDQDYVLSGSIGISVYPHDGSDAETLLKHADIAMYRAKERGRNTYQFYSPDMGVRASQRLSLETSLHQALARDEFSLCYQPQVDITTGEIVAAEALLRWRHPDLGSVAPAVFIPALEDTGMIVSVGEWVLRTACNEARRWQDLAGRPIRVAVNLSARQFDAAGFGDIVDKVLIESGLAPPLLELEVTESLIIQDSPNIVETFMALDAIGVRLALDDFGTGYSSLSSLKRFPVDAIKIDRSFIRDVPSDADDAAIVRAIIAMAASLKTEVIAEGVESEEQLTFLRKHKCSLAQGTCFSPPLRPAETVALLQRSIRPDAGDPG